MSAPHIFSEQEVVARFLGDPSPENYAAVFRILLPQVLTWFRVRGCAPEIAEDLAQDVLLSVFRSSGQLRSENLFRPWLFRIARNRLLQHLENETKETKIMVAGCAIDGQATGQADPAAAAEAAQQFQQWMETLSEKEREAILLRYVDGHEFHEIADLLEIPAGTAQWRVFQSVRKLSARFGGSR